jgi:hypothetical protein
MDYHVDYQHRSTEQIYNNHSSSLVGYQHTQQNDYHLHLLMQNQYNKQRSQSFNENNLSN